MEMQKMDMPHVDIDDEELEALIDFQESMARDAEESLEAQEAEQRKSRAVFLKKLRGKLRK
jgi:hypothetical protein